MRLLRVRRSVQRSDETVGGLVAPADTVDPAFDVEAFLAKVGSPTMRGEAVATVGNRAADDLWQAVPAAIRQKIEEIAAVAHVPPLERSSLIAGIRAWTSSGSRARASIASRSISASSSALGAEWSSSAS